MRDAISLFHKPYNKLEYVQLPAIKGGPLLLIQGPGTRSRWDGLFLANVSNGCQLGRRAFLVAGKPYFGEKRLAVTAMATALHRGPELEETLTENLLDEWGFVRRSALDTDGQRKTVTSADGEDLRAFAALGRANGELPFFALMKEASMNTLVQGQLPAGS